VVDLQRDLGNHERPILEQEIVRLQHAAALRVLDRDQREVNGLIGDPVEGVTQRTERLRGR
jgi:hypothetical protein